MTMYPCTQNKVVTIMHSTMEASNLYAWTSSRAIPIKKA